MIFPAKVSHEHAMTAVIGGLNSSSDRVHKFTRLLMEEGALQQDKNTHLLVSVQML